MLCVCSVNSLLPILPLENRNPDIVVCGALQSNLVHEMCDLEGLLNVHLSHENNASGVTYPPVHTMGQLLYSKASNHSVRPNCAEL